MTTNQEKFPSKTLELPPAWTCFWLMAGFFLFWLNFGVHFVNFFTVFLEPVFLIIFGLIAVAVIRQRPAGMRFGLSLRGMVALVAFVAALIFVFTMRILGTHRETIDVRLNVIVRDAATGRPMNGVQVTAFGRRYNNFDEGTSYDNAKLARAITDKEGRGTIEYHSNTSMEHSWFMVKVTPHLYPFRIEIRDDSHYYHRYYSPDFPSEYHTALPTSSYPPAKPISMEIHVDLDKSQSKSIQSTKLPIIPQS